MFQAGRNALSATELDEMGATSSRTSRSRSSAHDRFEGAVARIAASSSRSGLPRSPSSPRHAHRGSSSDTARAIPNTSTLVNISIIHCGIYVGELTGEWVEAGAPFWQRLSMIIWIASYPRSGNSLTRQILRQCFGVKRTGDTKRLFGVAPTDAAEQIAQARRDDKTWFVKTHREAAILDEEKCLYPYRDARAALYSYRQFEKDVNGKDYSLEEMVLWRRSWSEHIQWAFGRPASNTLMLRYEELVNVPPDILARISSFIELPILNTAILPFSEVQRQRPMFAKIGHNGVGIAAVEGQCSELFWQTHGEMMGRLGYS